MTPASDNKSYYFWSVCRNYRIDDVCLTTQWREATKGIFGQDEAILNAQQKAIDRNPDKVFYDLNIDAGAMWARRKIDQMIARENHAARKTA